MEMKKESTSIEETCLENIKDILERLPGKGERVNLDVFKKECKKIEVSSSIA
ncbi:hypothetical protein [Clostridium neonatale]|uniref:hypothetical protein n=1 Tax=Clostridium neonatale TaxID=137838 RepID=UPI00291C0415|nr:hypothetical protein CNEO4_240005 [Clostridium neonatale]